MKEVVFVGDSLIRGGEWSAYIPEIPVRNLGISGDTTHGILQRLDRVVDGRPVVVVLMAGTNDISAGYTSSAIVRNLMMIAEEIRARSPGTSVIGHTLLPRQWRYRRQVKDVNCQVRVSLPDAVDALVDIYPRFVDESGRLRRSLTADRLHLLSSGYAVWWQLLAPVLTDILAE